jgi:SNF2 family DNA or RNA helicase
MEFKVKENEAAMNYYETKLKEINERIASLQTVYESDAPVYDTKDIEETKEDDVSYEKLKDSIDCLICLDKVSVDCTMLQCGHIFCRECIMFAIDAGMPKCPTCKMSLKNTKLYSPILKKKVSGFNDLINAYGTKIAHLINLCKTKFSSQKIILYSHSPSLIKNIVDILNKSGIKTITPESQTTISNTIKQFKDDINCRMMVLSSDLNASGLTLTFASVCIILQPLEGSYSMRKQIEAQLVGRLHRIGQTENVVLLRLIMSNSIESEIEMENKIIDMIYQTDEQSAPFAIKANKKTSIEV